MKNQVSKAIAKPRYENLVIKLWCQLAKNNLSVACLFEFMKLIQLAIVQVIGNVEDEKTFSTLFFMKSNLWNHLAWHLNIVICMFA
jgi:hypothetical protein